MISHKFSIFIYILIDNILTANLTPLSDLSLINDDFNNSHGQRLKKFHLNSLNSYVNSNFLQKRSNYSASYNSIELISEPNSILHGQISIGTDPCYTFDVIFDTGSSEIWIPYKTCNSKQCLNKRKYSKTSSFKPIFDENGNNSSVSVRYLSGTISGFKGIDDIKLTDNLTLDEVCIGFATSYDIQTNVNMTWDGIVGLGFPNSEIVDNGLNSIVNKLNTGLKGMRNQFSYYVNKEEVGGYTRGMITFGGVDRNLISNDNQFHWTNCATDTSYWTVNFEATISNYKSSNNTLAISTRGILDTGSQLIYIPKKDYKQLGFDKLNCRESHTLPILNLKFSDTTGGSFTLKMDPDDYVISDGNNCTLGIIMEDQTENYGISGWTLGQKFFQKFHTLFDIDSRNVAFRAM